MVQVKELKGDKNKKNKTVQQVKQQPKKPQLQFASSDEESDDEDEEMAEDFYDDELAEGFEDEDNLDIEDLEGEDELESEDEEESDEDTGPLKKPSGLLKGLVQPKTKGTPKATPKLAVNGAGDANSKTPKSAIKDAKVEPPTSAKSKKNVDFSSVSSPTPTKTPSTPHPAAAKGKKVPSSAKVTSMEVDTTPQNKKGVKEPTSAPAAGKKRKASDENGGINGTPSAKLARNEEIISEEQRRRDERNKRTLFLKGVGKLVRKSNELKDLHPDIVSVRTMGVNAWLVFPSEPTCNKAHDMLSKAKIKGKSFDVDFCGTKSKNADLSKETANRPINKKAILIQGLPNDITAEKLKLIFPAAKDIDIPHKKKKSTTCMAFVKFANEQDAQSAFRKGESLKVGGVPVEVLFARERKQ